MAMWGRSATFRLSSVQVSCYTFRDEPCGAAYNQLIDACCRVATTFGLIVRDPSKSPAEALVGQLDAARAYECDVTTVHEWPGTVLLGSEPATLHRYTVDARSRAFLLSATDCLFGWIHPQSAEDLCFFRADGTVILTTTSHERDAYLTLTQAEVLDTFMGYSTFVELAQLEGEFDRDERIPS